MSTEHATFILGADKSNFNKALSDVKKDLAGSTNKSLLKGINDARASMAGIGAVMGGLLGKEIADSVGGQLKSVLGGAFTGFMVGGPAGAAVGALTGAIAELTSFMRENKQVAKETAEVMDRFTLSAAESAAAMEVFGRPPDQVIKTFLASFGSVGKVQDELAKLDKFTERIERKAQENLFEHRFGMTPEKAREFAASYKRNLSRAGGAPATDQSLIDQSGIPLSNETAAQKEAREIAFGRAEMEAQAARDRTADLIAQEEAGTRLEKLDEARMKRLEEEKPIQEKIVRLKGELGLIEHDLNSLTVSNNVEQERKLLLIQRQAEAASQLKALLGEAAKEANQAHLDFLKALDQPQQGPTFTGETLDQRLGPDGKMAAGLIDPKFINSRGRGFNMVDAANQAAADALMGERERGAHNVNQARLNTAENIARQRQGLSPLAPLRGMLDPGTRPGIKGGHQNTPASRLIEQLANALQAGGIPVTPKNGE